MSIRKLTKKRLEDLRIYYLNPHICLNCKKVIDVPSDLAIQKMKNRKFCDERCKKEYSIKIQTKICKNSLCQKVFLSKDHRQIFCSPSCAASVNNIGHSRVSSKKRRISYVCSNPLCNKGFERIESSKHNVQVYCSKQCRIAHNYVQLINKFELGLLSDTQVRTPSIRQYVLQKQNNLCAICSLPPFYNDKPLVFIVDHIDGDWMNNLPKNIRCICPNCNSQSDTFAGKNVGHGKYKLRKGIGSVSERNKGKFN